MSTSLLAITDLVNMGISAHHLCDCFKHSNIVLMKRELIGSFFFEENTICQANSLNMLKIFAYPLLRTRRRHMLFQLDGAPPHWGLQVCAFLKGKYLECWIGRGGPAAWPPRSPDINSLDFFLWGICENRSSILKIE